RSKKLRVRERVISSLRHFGHITSKVISAVEKRVRNDFTSRVGLPAVGRRILIPLPDRDFDTTEVAVPWRLLTRAGHEVVFATEAGGAAPACDPRLLDGVVFGKLGAADEPKRFYHELTQAPEFGAPIAWSAIAPSESD